MMRKGVVVFLAGIGLLCAGIVSTSDAFWGKQDRSVKIPIEIGDATTVDLRGMRVVKVRFSNAEQPGLRGVATLGGGPDGIAERLVIARSGSTLRLASGDEPFYGTTLILPPRISKVFVDGGSFEGDPGMRTLHIEASGFLSWKGDVDTLDLVSASKPSNRQRPGCRDHAGCVQTTFSIDGGRIGTLAIESSGGDIRLGDIANVGRIDLNLGPDAGLSGEHVADLARIRFRDRDAAPEPPSTH